MKPAEYLSPGRLRSSRCLLHCCPGLDQAHSCLGELSPASLETGETQMQSCFPAPGRTQSSRLCRPGLRVSIRSQTWKEISLLSLAEPHSLSHLLPLCLCVMCSYLCSLRHRAWSRSACTALRYLFTSHRIPDTCQTLIERSASWSLLSESPSQRQCCILNIYTKV